MPMFGGPLALIVIAAVAFYASAEMAARMRRRRATLDRGYADGEITKDRYDQMRRDLAT
jgi:uncharacterized membrane protein